MWEGPPQGVPLQMFVSRRIALEVFHGFPPASVITSEMIEKYNA